GGNERRPDRRLPGRTRPAPYVPDRPTAPRNRDRRAIREGNPKAVQPRARSTLLRATHVLGPPCLGGNPIRPRATGRTFRSLRNRATDGPKPRQNNPALRRYGSPKA